MNPPKCPECGYFQMVGPMNWFQGWVFGCPVCKRLVKTNRKGEVDL